MKLEIVPHSACPCGGSCRGPSDSNFELRSISLQCWAVNTEPYTPSGSVNTVSLKHLHWAQHRSLHQESGKR